MTPIEKTLENLKKLRNVDKNLSFFVYTYDGVQRIGQIESVTTSKNSLFEYVLTTLEHFRGAEKHVQYQTKKLYLSKISGLTQLRVKTMELLF